MCRKFKYHVDKIILNSTYMINIKIDKIDIDNLYRKSIHVQYIPALCYAFAFIMESCARNFVTSYCRTSTSKVQPVLLFIFSTRLTFMLFFY